jgi:hypothetical protein
MTHYQCQWRAAAAAAATIAVLDTKRYDNLDWNIKFY